MQELLTIRTAFILRLNSNISNMKNRQFFVIFPHARDFVLSYVCLSMCMTVCAVQCAWPWSSTLWLVLFLMLWMHLTCFFHLLFSVCFRRFFSLCLFTTTSLPLHNSVTFLVFHIYFIGFLRVFVLLIFSECHCCRFSYAFDIVSWISIAIVTFYVALLNSFSAYSE